MFGIGMLRTLVTIADESSLTRAAERLNTSQPWVSEQLRQMEETLDLALVRRTRGKFLNLTPAGEAAVVIARRVVEAFDQGNRELDARRAGERKKLVVGAETITMEMSERNLLLIEFMETYPQIELVVENASNSDLFLGLRGGRFDLILALCPAPSPDFEVLELYGYEIKAFLPQDLASRPPFDTMEELSDTTVLTLPDSYHPEFLTGLREASAPARLQWRLCPETNFEAMLRNAIYTGTPALMPDLSHCFPELMAKMTVRPLGISPPMVASWALMRLPGYQRRASEAFWNLAARRSSQPAGGGN